MTASLLAAPRDRADAPASEEASRPEPEPEEASLGGASGASGRRLASNAAWLVVGQGAAKVAGFVFAIVVTRALGPVGFGAFGFATSFVALFLIFSRWGLDVALVREAATERGRLAELVASALALRAVLSVGLLGAAVALAPLFVGSGEALTALVLVGAALCLDELSASLAMVFKAFERMAFHSLVVLANRVLSTAASFAVLAAGGGLVAVCVTYFLGSLGSLVAGAAWFRRCFPEVRPRAATRATAARLFRHGAPLGVADALNMALFRADAVLLQALQGAAAVGLYGAAYRFFDSFLFVAWGLTTAVMPRMARAGRSAATGRTFGATLALLLGVFLPVAAVAPFAARWAIVAVFSDRYAAAAPAVAWLAAAAVFYAVAHLARTACLALGQRSRIAAIAGIALAFNLAVNVVAIPRFGFVGAAAATGAAEVLEAALLVAAFVRANGGLRLPAYVAAPPVAAAATAGVLWALGARGGAAVVVGGLAYSLALAAAGSLLAPAEVRRVLALLRRTATARLRPSGAGGRVAS